MGINELKKKKKENPVKSKTRKPTGCLGFERRRTDHVVEAIAYFPRAPNVSRVTARELFPLSRMPGWLGAVRTPFTNLTCRLSEFDFTCSAFWLLIPILFLSSARMKKINQTSELKTLIQTLAAIPLFGHTKTTPHTNWNG